MYMHVILYILYYRPICRLLIFGVYTDKLIPPSLRP